MFHTAPVPVWMLQPSGASSSGGTSASIFTAERSSTIACRANEDCPKNRPPSGCPARLIGEVPSTRLPPMRFCGIQVVQYAGCADAQDGQCPQEVKVSTTVSPGTTRVTAEPTASTTPVPSWPSTPGSGNGMWPAPMVRSVWQMPTAVILTWISVGCGSPSSTSWTVNGAPGPSTTAAWVVVTVGLR